MKMRLFALLLAWLSVTSWAEGQSADLAARLKVPPGFVVELVAGPPLVNHPMMANFDHQGRLFVAESSGLNLKAADLLKELPNKVLLLEGMDSKGRFAKTRVYADKMTFPSGALWHQNALYVTAAPHIWKLTERPKKTLTPNPSPGGRGEFELDRSELVSKFNFIGNAADIHGPFLGPDGRIYWCDGRHGHEIVRKDGSVSKGKAARIFHCRPDGSDVEVVCGGGMDNPVEIAFTDEGEPMVTVDILHNLPSRNDGIIFAIEGGNYPWHEVSKEFPRTGDLLPAIENLGWVAPSGIMRYRGRAFGDEYRNNLFTAQFNRHRIQRHILERKGAGFVCKTEDFLTTDDKNFHPTDVFEDADGSLLVIDTGGWFRIGCPTSQTAKPEFKGAIYRIRKSDMKPMDDERVSELRFSRWDWTKRSESDIIRAMFYFGPDVRDHGIEELARRGKSVLPGLQKTIELNPNTTHFVRDSVWIATRIDDPEARQFVRSFVNDKELSVKLSALHSVGLHRDVKALPSLLKIVAKDHPAAQRQAATALGRIKHADAIAPIMEAVPEAGDRFLEHALIYALIQIDHRDKTAAYLNDRNPLVRRAALLALDQMPNGNLTRDELAAQFNSDSKALTRAALDIVASRPKWAAEIKGLLADWLSTRQGNLVPRETLTSVLLALSKEPTVQDLMAKSLAGDGARSTRLIVLEVMGRAPLAKLPPDWTKEIGKALDQNDEELVREAITVLRTRGLTAFDRTLDRMVLDFKRSPETRLAAFGALAMRGGLIGAHAFEFLLTHLKNDQPPLARLAVAKGLSQAKLEENQLQRLTTAVASAGPIELPMLLAAYEKNTSLPVGLALLTALEKNANLTSLTPGAIEKALKHVPDDSRYRVQDLAKRLNVDAAKQKARLDELMPLATGGSIEQGRDIYFGNKAACSTCHAINNKGGGVGPDLGKIGAIRSGRDLLESIAFPSVSFARGFEPYVVETKKGKTYSGILSRESSDAVYLMTTERVEIRVGRDEIETFAPGRVSIMPQGLDAQLTRRELQDLLAYLQSLR